MSAINPTNYENQAQKLELALTTLPVSHPLRELLADSALLLLAAADGHQQSPCRDSTKVALIDKVYHWLPIDRTTPRGAKMQLINRKHGVAVHGTIGSNETFFTHWAPLPTFKD